MTKQQLFDNIIALVKFLKPEFYNKVTWVVVISGLALLSKSLIEKLVNILLKINFEIEITDGNDSVVGIVLVVLGLGYHLLSRKLEIRHGYHFKKEQDARRSAHDGNVFHRTNEIMDEASLKQTLDWIGSDHSYESEQISMIDKFYFEASEHKNVYLNDEIEEKKRLLLDSLGKLRHFLSFNCFVFPEYQVEARRFCLYPELNIDRCSGFPTSEESKRYGEKAEEMFELLDSAYESYVNYRMAVKRCLYL